MTEIFQTILYQPIFNLFVGLYDLVPDVGVAILIITVLLKLALYPLTSKSINAQKSLSELQPKMDALKAKYKDDQQTLAQETMKLYKEHKVNPFGSCLPLLIQLPIFLSLYWVLRDGLSSNNFEMLYAFIQNPGHINTVSLGIFELANPNIVLGVFAGAAQYWQAKMFSIKKAPQKAGEGAKDENMMTMMNKQMLYFMPIMTVIISTQLPGGLALYWFLSTLAQALQQHFILKKSKEENSDVIEGTIIE
ncbi:YidC/Oxa1 family membrane protein insertase [Patescibacteria group bacterium]|nr:YidC/Oxa1 family membrane protein insertase [Patescibacteria group bacterium]MBU1721678.1 YidC/Oxa1 family membrane protein insertase [Patescibacteria group bacterium]MBU1900987.1 YidC/Oxa1 family membrane protein insertase [Patescibacteria group bacterium]